MLFLFICHFFLLIVLVKSVQIPFINNAILKSVYSSNSTLIFNRTCDQCLCYSNLSYPVLNCFSNNSCQLFYVFPRTYQIQVTPGARLFFPQKLFPNASQCCVTNITSLLTKLKSANLTQISVNIPLPRELVIDSHGYLVAVEQNLNYLDRFNATTLQRMNHTSIPNSNQMAIGYDNGAYYILPLNSPMTVIDSENLTELTDITMTSVSGGRGVMFLNDGQTMVVTSYSNNSLVFFNRANVSSPQYTYNSRQVTKYVGPHGLWPVNNSFFYVTSYDNYSLYSYSSGGLTGSWAETLLFQTLKVNGSNGASHVTIDECNRFWFSLEGDTTLIYDQQGNLLGNYTIPNSQIIDIKIVDNYVMYFSDLQLGRLLRLDPHIEC